MRLNQKIAINNTCGYVPGLNSVLLGALRAAANLGWEVVGIRDGFDGLLFPERYGASGVAKLSLEWAESVSASGTPILGTANCSDPFHVRTINEESQVEEVDRSDDLLERICLQKIDAVISVAGMQPLSILLKLGRKGLNSICVPASVENNVAATQLSFGFNSTLSCVVELLENARRAAESSRKIGVVEVLGEHTGWLALQSGIANGADAVLIPEIPYHLDKVARKLRDLLASGRQHALVVVAEGAQPSADSRIEAAVAPIDPLKASLAPLASGTKSSHVIERCGCMAETVALELQRLVDHQTYPLALGQLIKGGALTAVDRQLGIAYGAAAVRAIREQQKGVLVSFQPPEVKFIPLAEAVNKIRTVPSNSVFIETARSLGISLGD
jgi:6-phosphofructokinase 1